MRYARLLIVALPILALTAVACAPAEEQAETAAEEATTTESDVEAIQDWVDVFEAVGDTDGSVDAFLALIADDVIWLRPGASTLVGKEEVSSWMRHFQELYTSALSRSIDEVVASGDLAFVRGTRTGVVTPREAGQPQQLSGKFIFILQRQADGAWRITRSIWNRDPSP